MFSTIASTKMYCYQYDFFKKQNIDVHQLKRLWWWPLYLAGPSAVASPPSPDSAVDSFCAAAQQQPLSILLLPSLYNTAPSLLHSDQ